MEKVVEREDSPIENIGRLTRRSRNKQAITTKLNGTKENVNNTSLVKKNESTTPVQDGVKKISTIDEKVHTPSTNSTTSTPRRKKDPLANLHSNLSPKYIGFSTPTHNLNSSAEEKTRSLRRRHNNSNSANETTEENNRDMEEDITFTPNSEGTVGFVRRTPRHRDSQNTPDNNIKRKKFVSPIDKLLIKNGAVMEFNNNLPLINHDKIMLRNKKVLTNGENKDELSEKELGVKELDDCDENLENIEIQSNCIKNDENLNECDEKFTNNEAHSNSFKDDKHFDDCNKSSQNNETHQSSFKANDKIDECDANSENDKISVDSLSNDKDLGCNGNIENHKIQSSFSKTDEELDDCDEYFDSNDTKSNSLKNNDLVDCDVFNEIESSSSKVFIGSCEDKDLHRVDKTSGNDENNSETIKSFHKETDNLDEEFESVESSSMSIDNESNDDQSDSVSISSEIAAQIDGDDTQISSNEIKNIESGETNGEDARSEAANSTKQAEDLLEVSSDCEMVDVTVKMEETEDPTTDQNLTQEEIAEHNTNHKQKNSANCEIVDVTIKMEETEGLTLDQYLPQEEIVEDNTNNKFGNSASCEIIDLTGNMEEIEDLKPDQHLPQEELAEDKSNHNLKNSADETKNSESLLPDNQTAEILYIIEQSKGPVIKIELEDEENESNNIYANAPTTTAKSPSNVSTDSAKGSSITHEGSRTPFSTGDLYWGQIYNFCYWPCIVCPDPVGKTIITEQMDRSGDQSVLVHVRFFADNGRRNWVKRENLMPFVGIESYQERIDDVREKYGSKSAKYKLYVPTKNKEQVWFEAVREANIVGEIAHAGRLEKFYELFEKSKAFHKLEKERRKSMYISVKSGTGSDIESFYGSNDNINSIALAAAMKNKRERSISPYSPAYSPIKPVAAKRRKLSGDKESSTFSSKRALLTNNSEETPTHTNLNLSQSSSVASTSSNSNFLNDMDLYNSLEFRKLYSCMKDYVMEQNQDEKLEKSLVVAVRNIWALRQLSRQQMECKLRDSLMENDIKPLLDMNNSGSVSEGSAKRLSSRLKTLMVRKSLLSQQKHNAMSEGSETPPSHTKQVEKVKKPINRPILEVIDDIFDLDDKYLFKGMCREPVCKYCFKPGNLRKCAKNCTYWLHEECLYIDFDQKVRRGHKAINGAKVNINDSLNGSQSSSLVSLLEVGNANHVTSDSDMPLVGADVVCKECSKNEPAKCMVCGTETKKADDPLVKCSMTQCERTFHPTCCKYWPQAKITISKNVIENFRCPAHVCHTCVSDDPKRKFQHLSNSKLTKCVKCPATYHMDSTCIPAGSQILTAAHIICPRHVSTKLDMTLNVNWCFICVGGGQLTCCETCPTAIHAHCLEIPIAANEGYICEECESGRLPLYGEMVWAKFRNFRWWPAIILPPTEIPKNIARKPHNPSDFVVRFFGTHDHGWISRRRVYLYLEGDSSEPPKSKSGLDLSYNKGVEEAKEIYEIVKAKKNQQRNSNDKKEKLHPQPYVRIKTNRAVPPVKLHINIEKVSKCECDAREENPCGPDTNCLNRVLYHECNPKICPAGERCQNQMFESRVSPRLDVVFMKERGFGLVCREPIKAGSFVIEYVGEIINDDEFQARLQQKSRDRDENFYFLTVDKGLLIDAGPKGNLARFMNHSCDPNCETQKWCVNSLNRVGLFAIRDIPENTELTFNYHWDDLLGNEKKTCYCGAKTCAGQIGAKIKDMETVKMPPTVIETGKKLLKTNPNPKATSKIKSNKKMLNKRGGKNKLKVKGKTKTITKKITGPIGIKKYLQSKAPSTSKPSTDESDTNQEASASRLLESPDIFE